MRISGCLGWLIFVQILFSCGIPDEEVRTVERLDGNWVSIAADSIYSDYEGFEHPDFDASDWKQVNVPHNWDRYHGFRREMHGNFHGYAWYRRTIEIPESEDDSRHFLFFEGVGSYATIWVNGHLVGSHAGGRTTFTIDITEVALPGDENLLAVRADHPAYIRDLPWVCGGCSNEWGFSEGSQPLGIFRPVHLVTTSSVRVEPFGVHIWNDTTVNHQLAALYINTEVRNYSEQPRTVTVENRLKNHRGRMVARESAEVHLTGGSKEIVSVVMSDIRNPSLWSIENPYLYTMETTVVENGEIIDQVEEPYGIRWVKWDVENLTGEGATNRFYLNGEPVFINGTAEYEHLMGRSHAFTVEMARSRASQIKSAGFNMFRDAHQPHNLRYHQCWEEWGMLWWPQMSAHIWFDNAEFRANFKARLRDFIRERRNSPANVIWGLQNESTLPKEFARECTEIFREMDPTASVQRPVATCNGGEGTDWNVIQNWSGTYGGNPYIYDQDLERQIFNGEYGAWRSAGLHTEGPYVQEGAYSEGRMCLLMEMKIRLGEKVSDRSCGHIQWLFASHENPGRIQSGEGSRELDRVGPVNYKGLYTIWGEPLAPYYMYRSNYAGKHEEPMLYIYAHSWPDRYIEPGIKDSIIIYSNCDEVELFNDLNGRSLGRLQHPGMGHHFRWDSVSIEYNLLHAVGYVDGKRVAQDMVMFHHLPEAPGIEKLKPSTETITRPSANVNYLYRVNCGGPDYTDSHGNVWQADVQWQDHESWGSLNWTDEFDNLPPFYASQRRSYDPISGTREWPLFQTYRYGMDQLRYRFPLQDGEYQVELFFIEPWYGIGGGLQCKDWRKFDVSVNGETVIHDLDIWSETGHNSALKKTIQTKVDGGMMEITFPDVKSGQAVISAIAVSALDGQFQEPAPQATGLISGLQLLNASGTWNLNKWMNTGDLQYNDSEGALYELPAELHGAEWISSSNRSKDSTGDLATFVVTRNAWVYVALARSTIQAPLWLNGWERDDGRDYMKSTHAGGTQYKVYQKYFSKGEKVVLGPNGGGAMYTVVVNAAHQMDHAIDLREETVYMAPDAKVYGPGTGYISFDSYDGTKISIPGEDVMEFEFTVGLASRYGLRFRFANMSADVMPVHMEIVSLDGTVQWAGEIEFISSPDQWRIMNTDTQVTINAGTYKLRLSTQKPGEMYFRWLRVQ